MAFDHVCLLLASLSKMAFEVGHMNGTCRVPYAKKYKDIVIFRAHVHLEKKKALLHFATCHLQLCYGFIAQA